VLTPCFSTKRRYIFSVKFITTFSHYKNLHTHTRRCAKGLAKYLISVAFVCCFICTTISVLAYSNLYCFSVSLIVLYSFVLYPAHVLQYFCVCNSIVSEKRWLGLYLYNCFYVIQCKVGGLVLVVRRFS